MPSASNCLVLASVPVFIFRTNIAYFFGCGIVDGGGGVKRTTSIANCKKALLNGNVSTVLIQLHHTWQGICVKDKTTLTVSYFQATPVLSSEKCSLVDV